MSRYISYFVLLLSLDTIFKVIVLNGNFINLILTDKVRVSLGLYKNLGCGFGLFSGYYWSLTFIRFFTLSLFIKRYFETSNAALLFLIFGGILNISDVLLFGFVLDYLNIEIFSYFCFVTNVSDLCIFICSISFLIGYEF